MGQPPRARASRPSGSASGSQASSPWHLPSPSVNSTASEHVNSSQQSGSDWRDLGANYTSEEHSQSDASAVAQTRLQQPSDSDAGSNHTDDPSLKPRRLPSHVTGGMLSPGSTGSVGSFREAVGLNGHGPVVGLEAHRDAISEASGLLQFNPRRRGNYRQGHRMRPSA